MKKKTSKLLAIFAIALTINSCSKDDNPVATVTGEGNLSVEFDNVFGSANLVLNTPNITSQGESIKISNVKYIISNIELTREDGVTFTYPKSQSYFIVSETDEDSQVLELTHIPSGNYTKISFGVGVDEAQYNAGEAAQQAFFDHAQAEQMATTWSDGYKYLSFEGFFTSPTITSETAFVVNTQKSAANYNYVTATLAFPDVALVRPTITPDVHIFADVSKIIDGTNKIKLSDHNPEGTGAVIASGTIMTDIMANVSAMFSVNHVHND